MLNNITFLSSVELPTTAPSPTMALPLINAQCLTVAPFPIINGPLRNAVGATSASLATQIFSPLFSYSSSDKVLPILFGEEYSYRNKIVLHGKDGKLGIYQKNSNDIVPIDQCLLVHPKINQIISMLNEINQDILEAIVKCSNDGREALVSITGKVTDTASLLKICDVLILNGEYLTTKLDITNPIGDYSFHESVDSFFQVHSTMTKELYDQVLNVIMKKHPKNVWDLYCGTGTIGIYVSKYCDQIIGVDNNPSNIQDANQNLILNDVHSIQYICDKVENVIDQYHEIDCIIVDPPRSGLDSKTKDIIKQTGAETIIYVSCDPVTLARDLKELSEGYEVQFIQPVNMFPKTYHVESISVLEKNK